MVHRAYNNSTYSTSEIATNNIIPNIHYFNINKIVCLLYSVKLFYNQYNNNRSFEEND